MQITKAQKIDLPSVRKLAEKFRLDYAGMEHDVFWTAREKDGIIGICGLKKHPDCFELCSLAVEQTSRRRGAGRKLVQALLDEVKSDVYLATIIPGFFERLGFIRVQSFPPSMKKGGEWCEGCDKKQCTVMVKRED